MFQVSNVAKRCVLLVLCAVVAGMAHADRVSSRGYDKATSTHELAGLVAYQGTYRDRGVRVRAQVAGDRLIRLWLAGANGCEVTLDPQGVASGEQIVIQAANTGDCALIQGADLTVLFNDQTLELKFIAGTLAMD